MLIERTECSSIFLGLLSLGSKLYRRGVRKRPTLDFRFHDPHCLSSSKEMLIYPKRSWLTRSSLQDLGDTGPVGKAGAFTLNFSVPGDSFLTKPLLFRLKGLQGSSLLHWLTWPCSLTFLLGMKAVQWVNLPYPENKYTFAGVELLFIDRLKDLFSCQWRGVKANPLIPPFLSPSLEIRYFITSFDNALDAIRCSRTLRDDLTFFSSTLILLMIAGLLACN